MFVFYCLLFDAYCRCQKDEVLHISARISDRNCQTLVFVAQHNRLRRAVARSTMQCPFNLFCSTLNNASVLLKISS